MRAPAPNRKSASSRSRTGLALLIVALSTASLVACGDDDTSADPARFCQINTELEQLDDFTTATPDEARDLIAQTRELLDAAENVAPDEISAAAEVSADSFRQILDFYTDADFDVDPADFETAITSGELPVDPPEAGVVFDWVDENCAS
mgnify:CR=1 FL=1